MLLVALSFMLALQMEKEYSPQDVVTIVFCCTHKSLTLGLYLLFTLSMVLFIKSTLILTTLLPNRNKA